MEVISDITNIKATKMKDDIMEETILPLYLDVENPDMAAHTRRVISEKISMLAVGFFKLDIIIADNKDKAINMPAEKSDS